MLNTPDFLDPEYYLYLFYFFILANLFIYGVNDYWDEENDNLNPRNDDKKYKVNNADRKKLLNAIYLVTGFSLILRYSRIFLRRLYSPFHLHPTSSVQYTSDLKIKPFLVGIIIYSNEPSGYYPLSISGIFVSNFHTNIAY